MALVGNEQRVVAEPAGASRLRCDGPFDRSFEVRFGAVGVGNQGNGDEPRCSLPNLGGPDPDKFTDQLQAIIRVRGVRSGIAGREHSGVTSEGVDEQTRVVGHRRHAGRVDKCPGLQAGIAP